MKQDINITQKELRLLIGALLEANEQRYFIESEDSKNIRFVIEIKIGKNEMSLISSKLNWEWADILTELKPDDTIGDQSVKIDWENQEQDLILYELAKISHKLLNYIEWFEVEINEIIELND